MQLPFYLKTINTVTCLWLLEIRVICLVSKRVLSNKQQICFCKQMILAILRSPIQYREIARLFLNRWVGTLLWVEGIYFWSPKPMYCITEWVAKLYFVFVLWFASNQRLKITHGRFMGSEFLKLWRHLRMPNIVN